MLEVPVYLITGFLESGKTTFIDEVLSSQDFADGERTILLVCEEGEVEYDAKELSRHNIEIVTVENEEDLTVSFLEQCHKKYKPRRVFVEFNGLWDPKRFVEELLPRRWQVVQVIMLVDGSTFEVYLNNMRGILGNMFALTELVIFTRCNPEMPLQKYRRAVKAVNPAAMLSFEDDEGEQIELGKEQPPYDLNAEVIEIDDVDFGLWFLDMTDNPDRYDGKTVRFIGKVMTNRRLGDNVFVPGRNAMTCCADDIRFIGYVCKSSHVKELTPKQWLEVTAEVKYEYSPAYGEEGPILYAKHLKSVEAPKDELVYFN
ncbi:MAG: GTP-binding protein [Lachnospiraceae bacterium]|nr:GTP-binding protein [Lachnospiraceae bacterium]